MLELTGLKMAEISWPQIEDAFKKGWPLVLPLGAACKEHGHHLPMNTDFLIAEYFANWVMKNYPVLIAPTIPYSFFPAFEEYPGSTSVNNITARNSIIETVEEWAKQMERCSKENAKKFYVLNTGVSTNKPLRDAQEKLKDNNIILDYLDFSLLYHHRDIIKITEQKVGTHADEIETSIMLYIKHEVVQMEKALPEECPDKPGPLTRDLNSIDKTISVTGAWGDPTKATRAKGEIAVNIIKEMLNNQLKQLFSKKSLNDPVAHRIASLHKG